MSRWIVLDIVLLCMVVPFALGVIYLVILSIAALLHPDSKQISGTYLGTRKEQNRFLILIPAHNEELLLGMILRQMKIQFYPASHFEIVVIADNCTDTTAEIARDSGATVLERQEPDNRGKGQALNWAFQRITQDWQSSWDAVVVIDADSLINPDFLWFMNEGLEDGYVAMQGYYGVLNVMGNWRTALSSAALAVFHFVRPLGRDKLGLPCGLKGNGMCFSRSLVERFGYPANSVVEDIELSLIYLRNGIGVKFIPGAQVYAQMAAKSSEANDQRTRWENGRKSLAIDWAIPLMVKGLKERSIPKIDASLDLFIPPLTLIVTPLSLGWLIILFITLFHVTTLSIIALAIWSASLLGVIFYIITGLVLTHSPPAVWLKLFFTPLFILWKISLYLQMACRKNPASEIWVRTKRQKM